MNLNANKVNHFYNSFVPISSNQNLNRKSIKKKKKKKKEQKKSKRKSNNKFDIFLPSINFIL